MHRIVMLSAAAFTLTASSLKAQSMEPRAGLSADYQEVVELYEQDGVDIVDHYDTLGVSAKLDIEYVRFNLGYSHNVGNHIRFADGGEEPDNGYRITTLHADALLKYPWYFAGDRFAAWPAFGLRYAHSLTYSYRGTGDRQVNSQPSDLVLRGGGGMDYAVSARVALTGSLLAGYNLTPGMGQHASSAQAWSLGLSLGALLTL